MRATLRLFALSLPCSLGACLAPPIEFCADCTMAVPDTTGNDPTVPTTGEDVQTVTGDNDDAGPSSTTTAPDTDTSDDTLGSTGQPEQPPLIIDGVVIPDYIDDNGVLSVQASTTNAEG